MIVRRIGQTEDAAGIILAVDGQPDGTVARKRFWRCNFLFAKSVAEVKAELQRVLASELATRKFSYPRSDGSAWTLTRSLSPRGPNRLHQLTLRCRHVIPRLGAPRLQ